MDCSECGGEKWISVQEGDMPAPVPAWCPKCTVVIDPVADPHSVQRALEQAGRNFTVLSGGTASGTYDPLSPA